MDLGILGLIYRCVRAKTVVHGVSGRDIALAASIWKTRPWFIVAVAWSHNVCVVVMYISMVGLVYRGIGAGTVTHGVLGRDIAFAVSIWRTGPWFILAVAWSHIVWVVVMDVGMLGLMLVWVG